MHHNVDRVLEPGPVAFNLIPTLYALRFVYVLSKKPGENQIIAPFKG